MKILVPIKRVVDHNINVKIDKNSQKIETDNLKMVINPFCEIALEEAIKLKESGVASSVIALSIGSIEVQEQLRSAIAMGADRAIHVLSPTTPSSLIIAKIIQKIIQIENPNITLLGKQSIDSDNNQTGQMLAALCDYPQGTFISSLTITDDKSNAIVNRETDEGLQELSLQLPAILTVDLRLNTPRYISLPNIMKARRATIESLNADDFNINLTTSITTLNLEEPSIQKSCTILPSFKELLSTIQQNAKGA